MKFRIRHVLPVVGLFLWIATPSGQQPAAPAGRAVDGEMLLRFRPQATAASRDSAIARIGGKLLRRFGTINIDHVSLPRGRRVTDALTTIAGDANVMSAQPNYIRQVVAGPPNDFFWVNDVQFGFYGIKRIQADQVWANYSTGSSAIVIANLDTGVRYIHPDLFENMWRNPGEIAGNGQDDDANGYVDDVYGIDAVNDDSNPMDDHGHGTHTAGTFGAVGNNGADQLTGAGLVGVNWAVKILACKFINAQGLGTDADAVECFDYITALKNRGINIRVSNNSWGFARRDDEFPQVLKDAIDAAGAAGILNVFAAGNGGPDGIGDDIDAHPFDPASFDSDSIISVAASDGGDTRATFSNYGATSVDVAAPGDAIISAGIGTLSNCIGFGCTYTSMSGTSMAAPHVTGAAALLSAISPGTPASGLKSLLINGSTALPAWSGVVAAGGRLNVFTSAQMLAADTPPAVSITSPSHGATFAAPATITIDASATDDGSISQVDFLAGSTLIGSDNTNPFSIVSAGIPDGTHALTAQATDNLGNVVTSAPVSITVFTPIVDSTKPQLSLSVTPTVLWPANGHLVRVTATIAVTDDMDPSPTVTLQSITSSESAKRARDLDIEEAAIGTDDRTFLLRAERAGNGDRTYAIVYRATDRTGNFVDAAARVIVPAKGPR